MQQLYLKEINFKHALKGGQITRAPMCINCYHIDDRQAAMGAFVCFGVPMDITGSPAKPLAGWFWSHFDLALWIKWARDMKAWKAKYTFVPNLFLRVRSMLISLQMRSNYCFILVLIQRYSNHVRMTWSSWSRPGIKEKQWDLRRIYASQWNL